MPAANVWYAAEDITLSPLWEDGCALMIEPTGQTLALDPFSAHILECLVAGPATESALCDDVLDALDEPRPVQREKVEMQIAAALLEFERLDILRRRP